MIKLEKYIEEYLWRVMDILRGTFDLNTAQKIALEIMFLKLLNGMQQRKEKNVNKFITGKLRVLYSIDSENTFLQELNDFIKKNTILNNVVSEIFRLENADYKLIKSLQESIETLEIQENPAEAFRMCIDALSKDSKTEFNTTPNITKLISNLLRGIKAKTIYDPAIGTGYLITKVANKYKNISINGQDINGEIIRVCKMLLILEGRFQDVNNIKEGHTIIDPAHTVEESIEKFDCIVSEPPFGIKDWGYNQLKNDKYNRFNRGIPAKSMGDYAFITHIVESLNTNGIAVVIEPSGVLFRGGAEAIIREALVNENLLDCIISLPSNMMYGTAISVNLLIFKKDRKKKDVLFIDISNSIESSKKLTILSDKVIDKITEVFEKRIEEVGFSRSVSIDEIKNNNYNLMVQRYIEEKNEREELDLSKLTLEVNELETKLENIHSDLKKYFN